MEEIINSIVNGHEYKVDLKGYSPDLVVRHLQLLGYEKGELETNGWQVDFWVSFTKDDYTTLELSGDWYYGNQTLQEI